MAGFPYWTLPLLSSVVWLAMILALFISWFVEGRPHYASMADTQRIAYISDVGADHLKPLFIAMSAVTVVTLDLAFIAERWLRHTGKLHRNTSTLQKVLSILSIIAAVVGAAGLILLSTFDTLHYHTRHDIFLTLFIGGYIISAIFICWEYQRLGMHFREHAILRMSFWVKLAFILLEVALAIGFGVCTRKGLYNAAAIIEWTIALIFTFYLFSFFMDFLPARDAKGRETGETQVDEAMDRAEGDGTVNGRHHPGAYGSQGGRFYGNGVNGYANGHTNGHANGYVAPKYTSQRPSRNF